MVRRWLGLGQLGLAMAKPTERYARSMVANADDLLRWFPNASLVVLRGAAVQIGIEELGMAEALLGSELFPKDALRFGLGIYNPSLAHAKPGYLLAMFRASNWHYCPESGWDGNWTSVPHHKAQANQYNQPILATLKLPDLTVVEAVPVAFQRDSFRARFQEVQDGKVLAERSIEGPEDLRLYKFEEDYWLSFSFRTAYIAKLRTRLCFGSRAHGCTPAAWIETGSLTEITPEALHRREHREQQAFKNLNIATLRKESVLVEFSLNPRVMLEVDWASGLWQQVSSTQTPALPLLPTSQFFYRGGFCCVGPVDWGGREVSLGIAHIKFNRYVFLHRFYVVNNKSPYEVLATSPELCFHYLGQAGLAWDELGPGCETVQFASGMVLQKLHSEDQTILLSAGVNDCESAFLILSLDVVLELLVPVETSGSRWEADAKELVNLPKTSKDLPLSRTLRAMMLLSQAGPFRKKAVAKAHWRLVLLWARRLLAASARPCQGKEMAASCLEEQSAFKDALSWIRPLWHLRGELKHLPSWKEQRQVLLQLKAASQHLLLHDEAKTLTSELAELDAEAR
ncbi:unnamed protein product [Symbiodinium sp. CCMP2592]|nr:unnamed protein product [Symbiodinium sp. CCMP2592]